MATISYHFDQFDESKKLALLTERSSAVSKQDTTALNNNSKEVSQASSTDQDFSFWDFLDIINPLHHIPIVGSVYRAISGDEIAPPAKIIGGGLFGGLPGVASSVFDAVVENVSGKTLSDHVVALATGATDNPSSVPKAPEDSTPDSPIQLASVETTDIPPATLDQILLDDNEQAIIEIFARHYVDHQGNTIPSSVIRAGY